MFEDKQKGALQSLTLWGIIVSLAGLVADRSGEIQLLCEQAVPSQWVFTCAPVIAIIIQVAGLTAAWKGRTRLGDIKGLWRK